MSRLLARQDLPARLLLDRILPPAKTPKVLHTPKVAARCLLLAKYRLVLLAIIAKVCKESCEGWQISNAIASISDVSDTSRTAVALLLVRTHCVFCAIGLVRCGSLKSLTQSSTFSLYSSS